MSESSTTSVSCFSFFPTDCNDMCFLGEQRVSSVCVAALYLLNHDTFDIPFAIIWQLHNHWRGLLVDGFYLLFTRPVSELSLKENIIFVHFKRFSFALGLITVRCKWLLSVFLRLVYTGSTSVRRVWKGTLANKVHKLNHKISVEDPLWKIATPRNVHMVNNSQKFFLRRLHRQETQVWQTNTLRTC